MFPYLNIQKKHKEKKVVSRGQTFGVRVPTERSHLVQLACVTISLNMEGPNEFELSTLPTDGISTVRFGPTSTGFLLASSWDKVRAFDSFSLGLWRNWRVS